jgi:hypothetical protein
LQHVAAEFCAFGHVRPQLACIAVSPRAASCIQGRGQCFPLASAGILVPNSSSKPNLLRSTKHMASKACHVLGSATQVGLTQVLGGRKALSLFYLDTVAIDSRRWRHLRSRTSPRLRAATLQLVVRWLRPVRLRLHLQALHASGGLFRHAHGRWTASEAPGCSGFGARAVTANLGFSLLRCRLTIRPSRRRFAARLNSGVRGHSMRFALLLFSLLILAGCAESRLGPQKAPEYFVTPNVNYLGEATGEFPDAVKRAVLPALQAASDVERAYLVTFEYPDGTAGTCLCLTPGAAESMKTAEAIGEAFGLIAEQGVYLDIMFLTTENVPSVEQVARPFYVRP